MKIGQVMAATGVLIAGMAAKADEGTRGEVVGLIFDGNLYSLIADVAFDTENARATAVDRRGLIEALRSVYRADELVKELTTR